MDDSCEEENMVADFGHIETERDVAITRMKKMEARLERLQKVCLLVRESVFKTILSHVHETCACYRCKALREIDAEIASIKD